MSVISRGECSDRRPYFLESTPVRQDGDSGFWRMFPSVLDAFEIPVKELLQIIDIPWSIEIKPFLGRMETYPLVLRRGRFPTSYGTLAVIP